MSQYLYFFARHNKELIPIADYSRSTKVYSEVNAPYEKIRAIDETELRTIAERDCGLAKFLPKRRLKLSTANWNLFLVRIILLKRS